MALAKSRLLVNLTRNWRVTRICFSSDKAGDSTGGRDGAIREAGGSFGRKEAAEEERYFRKLQSEQLKSMKSVFEDDIDFHREQVKVHKKAIGKHEKRIKELQKKRDEQDD